MLKLTDFRHSNALIMQIAKKMFRNFFFTDLLTSLLVGELMDGDIGLQIVDLEFIYFVFFTRKL